MKEALTEIAARIGSAHLLTHPQDITPYLSEQRGLWEGAAACAVAKPATVEEVAMIVQIASRFGLHIIPQGGCTGLVGGQLGFDSRKALIVNMSRMNRIRKIDKENNVLIVEAGCVLADVHLAAEKIGRQFPLRLASEGSAQIGGLLATNAGGHHVLRYGMMRDLTLGVEAVLANGMVWNGLNILRKDNSGYDLKHLLIGSEGTLALLTAAVLKLVPQEHNLTTAMVALPSMQEAVRLFQRAQWLAFDDLVAFELLSRRGVAFMLKHFDGARDPFDKPSDYYVLIDSRDTAPIEKILSQHNAVIAQSQAQAEQLWFLRENLSDVQKKEGASIKHDISLPISAWTAFTATARAAISKHIPDIRPVIFGHLGDGNLHFNLSRPKKMSDEDFLNSRPLVNKTIYDLVLRHHGSCSAEHGIGVLKREELVEQKGAVALEMMRSVKASLDPKGLFNPNKIFYHSSI